MAAKDLNGWQRCARCGMWVCWVWGAWTDKGCSPDCPVRPTGWRRLNPGAYNHKPEGVTR
jgi:hypothetical protein